MGATIQQESGLSVLRVTGVLRKSELDAAQAAGLQATGGPDKTRLLVIAEDFDGWEKGADWGDMEFFLKYGDRIERIAIVADPKWETQMLMFAGAGFRKAPVKFFPLGSIDEARTWLSANS